MRQRNSNLFSPDDGTLLTGRSNDKGDGDNSSNGDGNGNGSQSDPEEFITAAHPDEETGPAGEAASDEAVSVSQTKNLLDGMRANKTKWAQCVTIAIAAFATYSFHCVGVRVNVQMAIMTVITLVGASPFCRTHLTTAAIGAFVGGQNIIWATHGLELPNVGDNLFASYLWLLVLSAGVGSVWCYFITHPNIQLLDGYAGRLGTTTFIGMNLVMVILWGPLGVVSWSRYYYGFVGIVHVAEEDSAPPSLASAWSWMEEAELAIGYVLAVLWLGVLSGVTRLKHHKFVQEWHRDRRDEDPREAPTPLNNVLIPVLWTLVSILLANATGYKHAFGLYNGFAVGAYVGMASLQKIPSIAKFATVSLLAAAWGLALTPFFVGFAGKSGFTSMMGHITHVGIEKIMWERIYNQLHRKQRLQQQREAQAEEQRLREEAEELNLQQEEEKQQLLHEQQLREAEERQKSSAKPSSPYHPPHKPSRKKELVFSTKQQRRQQQRLKQQQQNEQRDQQQQEQEQQQHPNRTQNHPPHEAPLRHRAWVATPADGDDVWVYEGSTATASQTPKLDIV